MTRLWLGIAGIGGLVSVIAGAIAAHAAGDPHAAELLRTGGLFGMVHSAALVGVIALARGSAAQGTAAPRGTIALAGWSFAGGIVLFSFSLFAMAAGGGRWLGWITPFGGVALMLGWAALATLALRRG